jgi:hypothetical protein
MGKAPQGNQIRRQKGIPKRKKSDFQMALSCKIEYLETNKSAYSINALEFVHGGPNRIK